MRMPEVQYSYFAFLGGLDQVTPPFKIPPGCARSSLNFECGVNGGDTRIKGYERYDGRPRPSAASFALLYATITGSYALGNTLAGATSGATGVIVAAVTTGADPYFVLTKLSGTFSNGENLNVGGPTIAVAVGSQVVNSAPTSALNATYKNLAADQYRADIGQPTGSGSILGGFLYAGTNYCFRNNAGGTAAGLWKSSGSGWTAVALGRELSFTSGGTTEIVDGNTITGAISGATAVVTRVVLESGTWAAGTAAGRLIFASQTGTFQAENLNVGATLNIATIAGNSSAITLLPSGRYECIQHNFTGNSTTKRVYGCDGVNRGFEFDGTVFVPIDTGMTTDTPNHVTAHKNQLFFAFAGGSNQHSAPGEPYQFSIITGAAEIAVGDDVTGYLSMPGDSASGALIIYTRNKTMVLYGNGSSDWNLVTYNDEAGALEWTAQFIGQGVVLDDRGITTLGTTANYGNFKDATISEKVQPTLVDLKPSAIASCIVRDKNQYRLFFSGGDALYLTFDGKKLAGIMPITFDHPAVCCWGGENSSGAEELYFGSTDGYVYQMECGTSFDGNAMSYRLELAYHHMGSPRVRKRFRKAVIEVTGSSYASFNFTTSLSYGSAYIEASETTAITASLSETNWDGVSWDQFYWDGQTLIPSEASLTGTAENISLVFSGQSDEIDSFTLNGAIIHYTPRRGMR